MQRRTFMRGGLYLLQAILAFFLWRVKPFYENHLGFMRSILHRSLKLDRLVGSWVWVLGLVMLLLAILAVRRQQNLATGLWLLYALAWLVFAVISNFQSQRLYYVWLLGGLFLYIFQALNVFLRQRPKRTVR